MLTFKVCSISGLYIILSVFSGGKPFCGVVESIALFGSHMQLLVFTRSPSQINTLGNGNCAPRALCDQLNLATNDPELDFSQEDHMYARHCTVSFIKKKVSAKSLDAEYLVPSPAIYLASMSKHGVFVDALFIQYFAKMLEKDVIIVPVHPSTGSGFIGDFKDFTWVMGKYHV